MKPSIAISTILLMSVGCARDVSVKPPQVERLERISRLVAGVGIAMRRVDLTIKELREGEMISEFEFVGAGKVVGNLLKAQESTAKIISELRELSETQTVTIYDALRPSFEEFRKALADKDVFNFVNDEARRRAIVVTALAQTTIDILEISLQIRR